MRIELVLRFGYGAIVPWVTRLEDGALRAIAGPDMVVLRTDVPLHGADLRTEGEFTVSRRRARALRPHAGAPRTSRSRRAVDPFEALRAHRDVLARVVVPLHLRGRVARGGDALAPHAQGADLRAHRRHRRRAHDVAAGGARRHAQLGLSLTAGCATRRSRCSRSWTPGYYEEAQRLARLAAARRGRQPRPGADHVRPRAANGSCSSGRCPGSPATRTPRPVRIGNAAHSQLQLDVFGEVMDALHQARSGGLPESEEAWQLEKALIVHLERVWTSPTRASGRCAAARSTSPTRR